jgi:hypothetical protein
VNETRDQGVLIAAPVQTAIAFAGHVAAIRSVCDELNNIRVADDHRYFSRLDDRHCDRDAVVGRLIWPVLPQRVLQDNLLTLFAQIKALLSGDPHREKIQTQLAILPVEALRAARQIRIVGCSEEFSELGRCVQNSFNGTFDRIEESFCCLSIKVNCITILFSSFRIVSVFH